MKLVYDIGDKPKFGQTLIFAFQQIIAIMAATLLVPILMSGFTIGDTKETLSFDPAAALFGAGIGTLVYILFTRRKSPVFLGSSFTFLGAYAAVIGQNYGYWGVLIGIGFAGLVYVILALIIKAVGSKWVNKLMPAVIIGPIVTLIGLSLSGTATGWMAGNGGDGYSLISILMGALTFLIIVFVSIRGSKHLKLIPFIVGVLSVFILTIILTFIGRASGVEALQLVDLHGLKEALLPGGNFSINTIFHLPQFTLVKAIQGGTQQITGTAIGNIALTFVPIAIVELAQHIGDHKNLSSVINRDLITDPGLDKTLLGDGVGSVVGGLFGGAANTTYGESIGCVAITGNASIISIVTAGIGCMIISFFTPFVAIINTLPKCIIGGACVALYGFIAVSGLQMFKKVDLGNNKNLFVVSAILVTGIGGLSLNFGFNPTTGGSLLTITSLATALIFGIITNLVVNRGRMTEKEERTDVLTGNVKEMGNAEFEDTNSLPKNK